MAFYGTKDLADAFRTVRKNTIQIAEDIPADKYSFKAAPGMKSVAELLAHVAGGSLWAIEMHGPNRVAAVDFATFAPLVAKAQAAEQALAQAGKDSILAALREKGDEFAAFLEGLNDDTLAERVTFPPPLQPSSKSRFEMILSVKEHEMHHRGQLMLIERLLGIVPHLTRQREAAMAERQAQPAAAR